MAFLYLKLQIMHYLNIVYVVYHHLLKFANVVQYSIAAGLALCHLRSTEKSL